MSDLVRNPEDRISRDAAYLIISGDQNKSDMHEKITTTHVVNRGIEEHVCSRGLISTKLFTVWLMGSLMRYGQSNLST